MQDQRADSIHRDCSPPCDSGDHASSYGSVGAFAPSETQERLLMRGFVRPSEDSIDLRNTTSPRPMSSAQRPLDIRGGRVSVKWYGEEGTHPVYELTLTLRGQPKVVKLKRFRDFKNLNEKVVLQSFK